MRKLSEFGIVLDIPDLNLGDFSRLKTSSQLAYLRRRIDSEEEYTLIGSSLGGLLSLILAEEYSCIRKLILIAPALEVKELWSRELGKDGVRLWADSGYCNLYHSGFKRELPLNYDFITDLNMIEDREFNRQLPVLIVHGEDDQTVPYIVSKRYQLRNKLTQLIKINSGDHGLENKLEDIWLLSKAYLGK